ncbi:MAG: protease family protein [Betaproteobacteria bacterium]|jgi:membrane protease YdiL (CAAX protease family)|nr:protease family protein [Betaproteobacteria bacterium]
MFGIAVLVLHLRGWVLDDFKFRITALYTATGVALLVAVELLHVVNWYLLGDLLGGTDVLAEFAQNTALGLPFAILLGIVNGIYEEFFLNRYLLDTLASLGAALAIGISVLVRISYHLYQGPTGAVSILLFGLVLTGFYWRFKQLWPAAFAHMTSNVIAFA